MNLLVCLDALLTEKNVRMAALSMGVTQSAMSHSLRQLRDIVGDPILVRDGNRMLPTPRAQEMARPLRAALQQLRQIVTMSSSFDPSQCQQAFRLAMNERAAVQIVPALYRRIAKVAPSIRLDVQDYRGAAAVEALSLGEVDAYVGMPLERQAIIEKPWLSVDFVAVCRAGHPDIDETLDLETYCRLPHALVGIRHTGPSPIDLLLEKLGKSRHIAVRLQSFLAAPWLVTETNLLLTMTRQGALHFKRYLDLQILDLPFTAPNASAVMSWHERFDAAPASAWFRTVLQQTLQELPTS